MDLRVGLTVHVMASRVSGVWCCYPVSDLGDYRKKGKQKKFYFLAPQFNKYTFFYSILKLFLEL